jgi:hypothetical protein
MSFFGGLVYHLYYACGAMLYCHRGSLHTKQIRSAVAEVRCNRAIFSGDETYQLRDDMQSYMDGGSPRVNGQSSKPLVLSGDGSCVPVLDKLGRSVEGILERDIVPRWS